jgi:hypothetical protein
MLTRVSSCSTIQLYFRYGVYDSPIPSTFLRQPVKPEFDEYRMYPRQANANAHHLEEDRNCTIILTSEAHSESERTVHFGTLGIDTEGSPMLSVAVKVASVDYERKRLRKEHNIYSHLHAQGVKGIPTVLGFFDDFDEEASCLVMLHCGRPLSDMKALIPSSTQYVNTFLIYAAPNLM